MNSFAVKMLYNSSSSDRHLFLRTYLLIKTIMLIIHSKTLGVRLRCKHSVFLSCQIEWYRYDRPISHT